MARKIKQRDYRPRPEPKRADTYRLDALLTGFVSHWEGRNMDVPEPIALFDYQVRAGLRDCVLRQHDDTIKTARTGHTIRAIPWEG